MNLRQLFLATPSLKSLSPPDLDLPIVTVDSRQVMAGALFVAVSGVQVDGHAYIQDAIKRGAAAVIGEAPVSGLTVPYFRVPNSRRTFSELAAAWHGHPARSLSLVGVTGTDGKTTTVNLIYHIMKHAGLRTGMVSTVNAVIGDQVQDTGLHVTTPDPWDVQGLLAGMVASGLTHAVLEVTSHGLAQYRVLPEIFNTVVLTNITHEHLDYHGSFEDYRDAKGMLFYAEPEAGESKVCVLNRADPSYEYLAARASGRVVSYGTAEADYVARRVDIEAAGLRADVHTPQGDIEMRSVLQGDYNMSNILAACAATVDGLGINLSDAADGIAALRGIPGRMERIDLGQAFTALVDFAHTPNALGVTLETCRALTSGSVIAVFGSAGLRDREKRRMMAEVAVQHADMSILTAEDPRTEALDAILAEMAAGAAAGGGIEGKSYVRVPDRGEAISLAVEKASPGDLVVVCGKGHEQSMCFGEIEYPWDDRIAMRAALAAHLGVDGPAMPYLPTSRNGEPAGGRRD